MVSIVTLSVMTSYNKLMLKNVFTVLQKAFSNWPNGTSLKPKNEEGGVSDRPILKISRVKQWRSLL